MGTFSIWHWLVVLAVILILFGGGGKLSRLMGDMAKGVNAFKKGLKDKDGDGDDESQKRIETEDVASSADVPKKDKTARG
jgi:sec-independent protein translocase protein TatA